MTLDALAQIMPQGTVYYVPAPSMPWLWPLLIICGIALQLLAIFRKSRWLAAGGLAAVLAGAIAERDITLAVGIILVSAALWFCIKKD